jgi:hypothetical protein
LKSFSEPNSDGTVFWFVGCLRAIGGPQSPIAFSHG